MMFCVDFYDEHSLGYDYLFTVNLCIYCIYSFIYCDLKKTKTNLDSPFPSYIFCTHPEKDCGNFW